MRRRLTLIVAVGLSGLIVAACGSSSSPRPGMMGQGSGNPMMGSTPTGAGYHFSRLRCAPPQTLPGSKVNVVLADMDMTRMMAGSAPLGAKMSLRASPSTVRRGLVSLVASNVGWRTHELVVLPLTHGAPAGRRTPGADGKVPETGSLGEASRACGGGAGDGITSATVGWTTLNLPAGRYELICNQPNHYADGMYAELDVT